MTLLSIIIGAIIVWQIIEDFQKRTVSLISLLCLASVALIKFYMTVPAFSPWHILYNSCFITFQILIMSLYMSIKNRKLSNALAGYFGTGDFFFLLALGVTVTFDWYLVYITVGTFFSLIFWLACLKLFKLKDRTVPFVSTMGIFYLLLISGIHLFELPGTIEDGWLFELINHSFK